jgi:hypothetical protein
VAHQKHVARDKITISHPHSAAESEWHSLNLAMQPQCQTNWCWLACAVSIALFYDKTSDATQCRLANDQLGQSNCCSAKCHSLDENTACNRSGVVSSALDELGHLEDSSPDELDFNAFRAEIDAQRPVSINIELKGGGYHIIVLDGYQLGEQGAPDMVSIKDPFHAPCMMAFADFPAKYLGGADWIRTIRTHEFKEPNT